MTQGKFEKHYESDWDAPHPERPFLDTRAATGTGNLGQTALAAAPEPAAPLLADWPRKHRAGLYPALFSRSALFQVGRGMAAGVGKRKVECQGDNDLFATGPRLSMRDKAVWERAHDQARANGDIGCEFELSLRAMAKALGAKDGRSGPTLRRLFDSLVRLADTALEFELTSGASGACKLLKVAAMRDEACVVSLDPDLGALLSADYLFELDIVRRQTLKLDLSKWLHDFHSTHKQFDGAFSLKTLAALCGYEATGGHFSSHLRAALNEAQTVAPGIVEGFNIERISVEAKKWRAAVTRGAEVVKFEMPGREWIARSAKSGAGGVAL